MNSVLPWILYNGHDTPPPDSVPLCAGPLSMFFENGDLRYIQLGEHEILRRIFVAVRDHNWDTIPAQITIQHKAIQSHSFLIQYQALHQQNDINFVWDATISGSADGTLRFTMEGTALSTFRRNRIGFCVLHPMSCAGTHCIVEHTDGQITEDVFPVDIAPQQPLYDIQAITHVIQTGLNVEVRFSGDSFEMEDQRNWTDASYKTYCTPLDLPFPVEIAAGTVIRQSVTMRSIGNISPIVRADQDTQSTAIKILMKDYPVGKLPQLGLCAGSHGQPLSSLEIELLRSLNLSHLRTDLHFIRPDWQDEFYRICREARALGVALDAALHLTDDADAELRALEGTLEEIEPQIRTWLLFHQSVISTPSKIVPLARQRLQPYQSTALFAGGTDAFFTQLNRERPTLDGLDIITYSLNPQVHAFDDMSLVETLPVQGVTLASARQFTGGKPLMVSPVTLKMRFNPAATTPNPEQSVDMIPPQFDVRQKSLFGAGWTLGSIKYLAEGGASSMTYYETTGWLGVMERAADLPLPDQFPSLLGIVYPMYHVLADVGEMSGAEVLHLRSSEPRRVDAIALRDERKTRVMLTNFTASRQRVDLIGLQGNGQLKILDEHTVQEALKFPETYRSRPGNAMISTEEGLSLELAPFAVAKIDMIPIKGD